MKMMNEVEANLPEVALSDLPEGTKDFLLAHSAAGKPVAEVIREVLNGAAAAVGYEQGEEPAEGGEA